MSKPIQSELARLDALITRCEALAEQSPGICRLRVGLLAHLGIVVVLAVVVGSVQLSVLLIFAIAGLSIIINELVAYGANLIGLERLSFDRSTGLAGPFRSGKYDNC